MINATVEASLRHSRFFFQLPSPGLDHQKLQVWEIATKIATIRSSEAVAVDLRMRGDQEIRNQMAIKTELLTAVIMAGRHDHAYYRAILRLNSLTDRVRARQRNACVLHQSAAPL